MNKFLLFCFFIFLSAFCISESTAQNWKADYDAFFGYFQKNEFGKAIKNGPALLDKMKTEKSADTAYADVCYYLAYAYFQEKKYESAIEYASKERDVRKSVQGIEHDSYLTCTYYLSIYYSYNADYINAIPLMQEVCAKMISKYGKSDVTTIHMVNQLANLFHLTGSLEDASALYESNYLTVKLNFKNTDSIYMVMVNSISAFYTGTGNYAKAEPYFKEALEVLGKKFGKKSEVYVTSLNSFGEFYIYSGEYDKSIKIYTEFVSLAGSYYGKKSADYATAINNLAVAYEKSGNYKQAEKLYLQALEIKEKVFTKKSDYYALTLVNLGVVYDYQGKYTEAEKILEEAISIYREIGKTENSNYATALSNISSVYSSLGKAKQAIKAIDESLVISKKLYGEKSIGYVTALNNKGSLLMEAGEYDFAEKIFEQTILIKREIQGNDHPDLAVSLFNYANLATGRGKYAVAETLLKESIAIAERSVGTEHQIYVNSLMSLAGVWSSTGNIKMAEKAYIRCGSIYRKILGPEHPEYSTFLANFGVFYLSVHHLEEAEKYLLAALELAKKTYGEDHIGTLSILFNLSLVAMEKNDFRLAENYMLKSQEIAKKQYGVNHPEYANILNSLAVLYFELGNYTKSEALYKEAIEKRKGIYGDKHPEYASSLNNLGTLYLTLTNIDITPEDFQHHAELAVSYFKQALHIDSLTNLEENRDLPSHLNNLAEAHRTLNNPEDALRLYNLALELELKYFGRYDSKVAVTYHNLSLLYAGTGRFHDAEKSALEAISIFETNFGKLCDASELATFSLGGIYQMENKNKEATETYLKAVQIHNHKLNYTFSHLSEQEKRAYLKSSETNLALFYSFAMKQQDLVGEVYDYENLQKGLLLRSSLQVKNQVLSSNDSGLIRTFEYWNLLKELAGKQNQIAEEYRTHNLDSLEEIINTEEKKLVAAAALLKVDLKEETVNCKKIQSLLKPDQLLIEFVRYLSVGDSMRESYAAIVVKSAGTSPVMIPLCGSTELESIFKGATGNDLVRAEKLYGKKGNYKSEFHRLLIQPIESQLKDVEEIIFAPTGILHNIAFAAIPDASGKLLSEKFVLRQLSHTSELKPQSEKIKFSSNPGMLLFGGIQYSELKGAAETWKYLPGTATEAENIYSIVSKVLPSMKRFGGIEASEEELKKYQGKNAPEIIHLATHGFYFADPETIKKQVSVETSDVQFRSSGSVSGSRVTNKDPLLRSGLILAKANDSWDQTNPGKSDGVLTAYEVSLLNLSSTQLLVLSACETALGEIDGNEGVYGLQRAFKMAGVKNIIMSLWQVPDKETTEFMTFFYSSLIQSYDIRKAFASAQAEMQKKYDPYYWAAFILVE